MSGQRWTESRASEWLHGPLESGITSGAVYYLKCLGSIEGPRWLDGKTVEGTVALAHATHYPYTGTRWRAQRFSDGAWAFRCLGEASGSRWLDGRTAHDSVGLALHPDAPFSGARWQVVPIREGVYALRCLGEISGNRFLDGVTASATTRLAPVAEPPYTGTHWELRRERWFAGCNFIPSTAVNQLEMWQAETFDLPTIDRELGWAQNLGFNAVRVFLHDLLWLDPTSFIDRLRAYLDCAAAHDISTLFVFFDDCWFQPPSALGTQPPPIPDTHNSRWLQSPGDQLAASSKEWSRLELYVKEILGELGDDERIIGWDLYNEPGGGLGHEKSPCGRAPRTLPLLTKIFEWARSVNPEQPLTAGVFAWDEPCTPLSSFQLGNSDVISFHRYADPKGPLPTVPSEIDALKTLRRPLLCTEYMARALVNSRFENHLDLFNERGVGCFNWGLVAGKTQTFVPWGNAPRSEWLHDIYHTWGTPYCETEVAIIRCLTGQEPSGAGLQHDAVYRFKCRGHHGPGPDGGRWLDGRTVTGELRLVGGDDPPPHSGTRWHVFEIAAGVFTFRCLGEIDGQRWLDGRTMDNSVGLAAEPSHAYSGTRWQLCRVREDVYVFRCLGEVEGARLLDGNTVTGTVSLAEYAEPRLTGLQWHAIKE